MKLSPDKDDGVPRQGAVLRVSRLTSASLSLLLEEMGMDYLRLLSGLKVDLGRYWSAVSMQLIFA